MATDRANYSSLGASLLARWPLDIVGAYYRTRRAEEELAQATAQAESARDGIAIEVSTLAAEITDATAREAAWHRGQRESRAWFVAAAQGYEVGAVEPKDLVDALRAYFTARFNHLQAIHDRNVGFAKLERATGRPLLEPSAWAPTCDADE